MCQFQVLNLQIETSLKFCLVYRQIKELILLEGGHFFTTNFLFNINFVLCFGRNYFELNLLKILIGHWTTKMPGKLVGPFSY